MKSELLNLLICPHCHCDLVLRAGKTDANNGEIREGTLQCCGSVDHVFPIVEYVPRFVSSEYYAESFGFEWNLFSSTQLDYEPDSTERWQIYHLREIRPGEQSRVTFTLKTGLCEDDLRGKLVLDAGCGMGRFLDVCSRMGAEVVGIDLSTAVLAAQRNTGCRPNVSIIQADLFNLPFRQESFDIIYSIGVLHHTPDTKQAFLSLLPYLKRQGRISIWVYAKRPRWKGKYPVPGLYFCSNRHYSNLI